MFPCIAPTLTLDGLERVSPIKTEKCISLRLSTNQFKHKSQILFLLNEVYECHD